MPQGYKKALRVVHEIKLLRMHELVYLHVFYLEKISFRIHHLTNSAGGMFHNISPCLCPFLPGGEIADFMGINC